MPLFARPVKVGILANEFLDPSIGRVGGFGWAARAAASVFEARPELEVEPVFLSGEHWARRNQPTEHTNGTRLVKRRGWRYNVRILAREKIDIILAIEYRPSYEAIFRALPVTPVIIWVRDPRTPADEAKILSLRLPGAETITPAGIGRIDSRRLASTVRWSRLIRRPILLANKMAYLRAKNRDTYGLPPSDFVLPNPDVIDYGRPAAQKPERPIVAFLGRLDPIKRPWLFIELARRFPDVEFVMLGANQQTVKQGIWQPENVPPNVRMLGHVNGEEKVRLLEHAWVLVNTSIHEEAPVSVLEALACRTPLLSYEDWGGIARRFGSTIGAHTGTGMAGMDALARALARLLDQQSWRMELGDRGREWVVQEHCSDQFIQSFRTLCTATGRSAFIHAGTASVPS